MIFTNAVSSTFITWEEGGRGGGGGRQDRKANVVKEP
jgi:hypothetical protein